MSIKSSKPREFVTCLVVTLIILVPSLNFISIQSTLGVNEPITSDNLDGNWTAEWSLNNVDNYTLSNIELANGVAALKKNTLQITQVAENVFDNGTSENLDGIVGSGIGLNLSKDMNILIADMNNSRVIEIADNGWYWQYGSNTTSGYGL
ncbi:MAG: hypothetical protein KAJ51_13885, partial [Thermoplasmata archaeon]|nr:hypothetical protein [Thermoplasmata archaeon]